MLKCIALHTFLIEKRHTFSVRFVGEFLKRNYQLSMLILRFA